MTNKYHLELSEAGSVPSSISPRLLWTDPPFGTGKVQSLGEHSYKDHADTEYVLEALIAWRGAMDDDGTMAVCTDYRLTHKVVDALTGGSDDAWVHRGDIVWTFGLGRPRTTWWANRHNVISTFTKTQVSGIFHYDAVPTEARRAQKDGYPSVKKVGSVWDKTLSNLDSERVGYPNQKPLDIIIPFVRAHTNPGDLVSDPFCGSGSTGVAAVLHGRKFYGGDSSPEAISIARSRLEKAVKGDR